MIYNNFNFRFLEVKRKTLLVILSFFSFLALNIPASAQNIEFFGSRLPYENKEIKEMIRKYKKAEDLYNQRIEGKYYLALEYYFDAYELNPNSALLNYKLGRCYLKATGPEKSLYYLRKADSLQTDVRNDLPYLLGQALQYNYRFEEAISRLMFYRSRLSPETLDTMKWLVDKHVAECKYGISYVSSPAKVSIKNMGRSINSKYHDYCAVVTADEKFLAFTSRRPENLGKNTNPYDYLPYEDIYFSLKIDTAWTIAENPGKPLNRRRHDATADISFDGKVMSIYRNRNLYQSVEGEKGWSKPKKLSKRINFENFLQYSASYSSDRKTIYFVSNREGGFGGTDIYKSTLDSDGFWSEAENLGPVVNSSYDEDGVFLLNDSLLYFSSKGHSSMGEYDLFVSKLTEKGWSAPQNLGYPVNSPSNDLYIYFAPSGMAYISSDRAGGYGAMDIYQINFNPTEDEWQKTLSVLPKSEQQIIQEQEAAREKECNRKYNIVIDSIIVEKANIIIRSEEKQSGAEVMVIENIYFDFDKFNLTKESIATLDRIVAVMKANAGWELMILGHTDNFGDEMYNTSLSFNRSKAAYDYLSNKGIAKERMMYAGFSYNKPAVNNDNPENRALNRRVEFRIIR